MRGTRAARAIVVCAAMIAVAFAPSPASAHASRGPSPTSGTSDHKRVGTLILTRCDVLPHAWCGHLDRPWDPTGSVKGDIRDGFAFLPASDQKDPVLGTVVPQEGGPGYSTTGSAVDYAAMYGSLLRRRNLLLFDQRGTGRSEAINCPRLQNLHGAYDIAAEALREAARATMRTSTPASCPPMTSQR